MVDYAKVLTECGYTVNRTDFIFMDEAAQVEVTNEALTGMMKFITNKYNSLDFSEIEKTAGDIGRFKYKQMLQSNLNTLETIYKASTDEGAKKYLEVTKSCNMILDHLQARRYDYSTLYKAGNGLIQLTYTSLVASVIYCVGTLVSNTIRFATTEINTPCEVLFDEIPGSIRHVHIRNAISGAKGIPNLNKILTEFMNLNKNKSAQMNEGVGMVSISPLLTKISASAAGKAAGAFIATPVGKVILISAAVIILIPWLINFLRNVIYAVYNFRTKLSEELAVQADLVRTNIESLDARGGNAKVIARQRKWAESLEKWQKRIALKSDSTEALMQAEMKKENQQLQLDQNNPLMNQDDSSDGILL